MFDNSVQNTHIDVDPTVPCWQFCAENIWLKKYSQKMWRLIKAKTHALILIDMHNWEKMLQIDEKSFPKICTKILQKCYKNITKMPENHPQKLFENITKMSENHSQKLWEET